MTRLEALYKSKIVSTLMEKFHYRNIMQVPKLDKIVVSMGVGRANQDKKLIEGGLNDLMQITGQKPLVCKAKISVSNFKLRQGQEIGLKVTLRGARMYEFFDRLVSLAIPRVRDFRGLNPNSFDGRGNYSMGLTEQAVFPEIDPDKISGVQGMNIAMVTTATTDEEGRELLKLFGMPFKGGTN
ncbi:MAG: 50S ribosomal protein L5 [Sedimentisphaerales bacterium]|nr:50S ribosomal protein L5 [Sedimentisphaerales bacterium]